MKIYSCNSKVARKSSPTINLTKAIMENIKTSGSKDHVIWNMIVDDEEKIKNILSFEELDNNFNVIKAYKLNISNETVRVPFFAAKIFSLSHRDAVKLEHHIIDEKSYIFIIPLKKSPKYENIKDNIFLIGQSKLIMKENFNRIVLPKMFRQEVNINVDDWIVLSVYQNVTEELYLEIVKLEDLINFNTNNKDNLVYRTLEQVSYVYSAYYFIPDNYLMDVFDIKSYEYANWRILFNEFDIIRLDFH